MTQIAVKDASGATVSVARVVDTGRVAAADSLPTVLSTEDKAAIDAIAAALGLTLASLSAIDGKVATATKQDTGNASLAGIDGKLPALALVRSVLLSAVTITGAGSAVADAGRPPSFSAQVVGTGAVSATVLIQGRNVASGEWVTLATITLSGTTSVADGFASLTRYVEYRANCTAISGTSAAVSVAMGS